MINARMREYTYFLISAETNSYGQQTIIKDENGEPLAQGTIKMSISLVSQSVKDSIAYRDASYIGLTQNKNISDHYVIQYNDKLLKVQYVTEGRFINVALGEYNG